MEIITIIKIILIIIKHAQYEAYCVGIILSVLYVLNPHKITTDGDCSHEIKRRLLLGRKVMTILDSILKSRDITLPAKVRLWFFLWSCMDVRVGL